jgi:hypothetical protein
MGRYAVIPKSFAYSALVVLVVLPVVGSLTYSNQIRDWWFMRNHQAEIEREFSCHAGTISLTDNDGKQVPVFSLTEVTPDGALGRAGVRAGDIPVGFKHGFQIGFYASLWTVHNGTPVQLSVVTAEEWPQGVSAWRRITIQP